MAELREMDDGSLHRGHGGDTLNTAVYLARLGVRVDYATALGDDAWSDEMVESCRAEGVGTELILRVPGRLPGLYVIQTDAAGERRFLYWRDSAAARQLFSLPQSPALADALAGYDVIYFSGITLSIFEPAARDALFRCLGAVRARGGRVVFDSNFRPRGWPDLECAARLFRQAFAQSDFVFASEEDLSQIYGAAGEAELAGYAGRAERILKLHRPAVQVVAGGEATLIEAEPVGRVVDTTAAGDSFAAAYLASRLAGLGPETAARAGHQLAGLVVGYPGAIIPRAAMPVLEPIR